MADHVTTRFGFTGLDPDPRAIEYLVNWPTAFNTTLDQIDGKVTGYSAGVFSSRPAAGTAGRVYLATDDTTSSPNGTLYFDNGTAWVIAPTNNYAAGTIAARPRTGTRGQLYYATDDTTAGANGTLYLFDGTGWNQVLTGSALNTYLGISGGGTTRRGAVSIATSETRTSTSYGLMPTPDRVQAVTLDTNGLIAIAYQAAWSESNVGTASAAIFIGSNQLAVGVPVGTSPQTTQWAASINGVANRLYPLSSHPLGLTSLQGETGAGASYTGDVTTGQAIGGGFIGNALIGAQSPYYMTGGPCYVFAAAGTYDVSVQFKSTSGSVTASGRKLWVWTIGF